jgi:hypothetical protein
VVVVKAVAARPAVPVIANPPLVVLNWIRSPATPERLDPNQQSVTSAMNSWDNVHPGSWLTPFHGGRFAIYRANFTPRAATQKTGGQLVLRDVAGKAQVWIDGKMDGEKATAERADMTVAFPAGNGERIVSVVIEAAQDEPAGLGGIVTVEEEAPATNRDTEGVSTGFQTINFLRRDLRRGLKWTRGGIIRNLVAAEFCPFAGSPFGVAGIQASGMDQDSHSRPGVRGNARLIVFAA